MTSIAHHAFWKTHALLIARLLMGGVFLMAASMKFMDISGQAQYVAMLHSSWPQPVILIWLAAFLELAIGLGLVLGVYFREAALVAGAYIIFLAFAFHGPGMWVGSQTEFGFFIDHFTMLSGLLFMAAHGAGETWKLGR
jgi:putative oxidoreductase